MKYLFFFILLFFTSDVFATIYIPSGGAAAGKEFSSGLSACHTSLPTYEGVYYKDHNEGEGGCYSSLGYLIPVQKKPSPICPPKNSLYVAWLPKGTTSIPIRMCIDNCTYEGSGRLTETPNYVNTTLFATGDQLNCKNVNSDTPPPKCDTTDPYGECYVPPNDDCVRSQNGSITCPPNTPPIAPKDPCNGATYCKKPPTGCGSGYVSGFFNGQELCVKSGPSTPPVKPNDPNDPNDPNKCTTSYCPKPDDTKDCPLGYYQTTYNGEKVCVKNNPDPTQPNSHDPNNNQPPSSEPTNNDSPNIDLKPIIDAIKSLKDALLSSLDTISKKVTDLVNGQQKTNETLEKSDKHLENIEKSSQAASDAAGESNKKLDSINDSIQEQQKCRNENYDPKDSSSKYRECTEQDFNQNQEDNKLDIQEKTINLEQDLRTDLFNSSSSCPPPISINITFIAPIHLEFPMTLLCDAAALVRPWVIFLGFLVAFLIVSGQRSGGSD
ncbi:MAG: virulence factor TspB C-terminal domain-related protein [Synergistaceae bacterium]